ncbi:MAG: ComEC/Rec2 family competence protein [Candidatus Excrementavichristensenella sp.]|jgi:competence protein ComEC
MKKGAERLLDRRPLALGVLLYVLGCIAGIAGSVPPTLWAMGMALCALGFLFSRRLICILCALLFVGAWSCAALGSITYPIPEGKCSVSGRVRAVHRQDKRRTVMTLEDVRVEGERLHTRLRLYDYGAGAASPGDRIQCIASLWRGEGRRNPGGFDFDAWLRRDGVGLCATANEVTRREGRPGPGGFFAGLREAFGERLDALYGDQALLARGMLLGDKQDMPEELYDRYRNAGLAHLLAVSGLHVTCMAAAIAFVLAALGLGRHVAFLVTLALTSCYALLVGAPASAVRAAIMFGVMGFARLWGKPYDGLTSLALAALLLLLPWPLKVADTGFMLSFLAVLGILLLYRPLRRAFRVSRWPKALRGVGDAVAVSLAAQLGTLAAVCCLFGQVTPYALVSGIPGIALCTAALPLIGLSLLAHAVSPALGLALSYAPRALLWLLSEVTRLTAALPGASLALPAWPWPLLILFGAALFLASDYLKVKPFVRYAAFAALPALALPALLLARLQVPGGLNCLFLDAGNADAAVLSAGRKTYLVDVGEEGGPTAGYLRHTGRQVDGLFLSHGHTDHAGGLGDILRDRHIPTIWLPVGFEESGVDESVLAHLEEARAKGSRIRYVARGDEIDLAPGIRALVLAPGADERGTGNAQSMVLKISYKDGSLLMTGDLPMALESGAAAPATLVKAAHHGSRDATGELLLRAASPAACVISVGSTRGPSRQLLDALARHGIPALRTDQSGAISADILPDGTLQVRTYK